METGEKIGQGQKDEVQGSAKVPGHLDFEVFIGRFSTFMIKILNLHANTFILAYCEPKLTQKYNFWLKSTQNKKLSDSVF